MSGGNPEFRRPEMGISRKPPSQSEAGREKQAVIARRLEEQEKNEEQELPLDPWEVRRQELAARVDIFDAHGRVTAQGNRILREAGWNQKQISHMQELQMQYARGAEVIVPARDQDADFQKPFVQDRTQEHARALPRAGEDVDTTRGAAHQRLLAGSRAYDAKIKAGFDEITARAAQQDAMAAFDTTLQKKRAA